MLDSTILRSEPLCQLVLDMSCTVGLSVLVCWKQLLIAFGNRVYGSNETEVWSKCAVEETKNVCRDVELFVHHSLIIVYGLYMLPGLHICTLLSESLSAELPKLWRQTSQRSLLLNASCVSLFTETWQATQQVSARHRALPVHKQKADSISEAHLVPHANDDLSPNGARARAKKARPQPTVVIILAVVCGMQCKI